MVFLIGTANQEVKAYLFDCFVGLGKVHDNMEKLAGTNYNAQQ